MMRFNDKAILVFGATGQQGGSVASAARRAGWQVRALVRDLASEKADALRRNGIETVPGDLRDEASLRSAMAGAYGVFSVQPSSGQATLYGVSDADEVRFGTAVADIAVGAGVQHLVYSSANAAGQGPTGLGHFDSKSHIEAHVRSLPIDTTIIRPSAFMEILTMPGLGLAEGRIAFFMHREQPMQFIAVDDIGKLVATIFAAPNDFRGRTLEIAGDAVTGVDVERHFSRAAGRPIAYARIDDSTLEATPFLGALAALLDDGRLAGRADIVALRALVPDMLTFEDWTAGPGKTGFLKALEADGAWAYGNG